MLRTYKARRGRLTTRQQRELEIDDGIRLPHDEARQSVELSQLERTFAGRPVIVDIGFGSGTPTAQRAMQEPDIGILAIDVHTPGVADLLGEVRSRGLTNVRIIEGDAVRVLAHAIRPAALAGARTYFPDPWPKVRHRKRRLIQAPFVALLASRIHEHGTWELATDWADYADQISRTIPDSLLWHGGEIARPMRPQTHFERRALHDGRAVIDFLFERTNAPAAEPVIGEPGKSSSPERHTD